MEPQTSEEMTGDTQEESSLEDHNEAADLEAGHERNLSPPEVRIDLENIEGLEEAEFEEVEISDEEESRNHRTR